MKKVDLNVFCFPYAGGGTSVFRFWQKETPDNIKIIPVVLPNRVNGVRFDRFDLLIKEVYEKLKKHLHNKYVLFGHSFGGLVAFSLSQYIIRKGMPGPQCLFISAMRAPHVPSKHKGLWKLNDDELEKKYPQITKKLGVENTDVKKIFLNFLRNDLCMLDKYTPHEKDHVECPIVALYGKADTIVSQNEIAEWKKYTGNKFSIYSVDDDHYFVTQKRKNVLSIIKNELEGICNAV